MDIKNLTANFIEISNIDVKNISDDDFKLLANLYINHLVIFIRGQVLEADEFLAFANRFGDLELLDETTQQQRGIPGLNGIQRVCAGTNPDGSQTGLFGHDSDLDWHANRPSAELERKPNVMLYAVEHSAGSKIGWLNMCLAYDDLPNDKKDWLEDKLGIYGFEPNTYTKHLPSNVWKSHRNNAGQKFIRTFDNRLKGMFYPKFQFFGFKDVPKEESDSMVEYLDNHTYKSNKYVYIHEYNDGDIIIGNQWLTVHKRYATTLGGRLLYRITTDNKKVIGKSF